MKMSPTHDEEIPALSATEVKKPASCCETRYRLKSTA
jgi:hypothetical protein